MSHLLTVASAIQNYYIRHLTTFVSFPGRLVIFSLCLILSTTLYLNNFLEVSSSGFRKPGPGKTLAVLDSYLDFRRRGEVSGGRQGSFHQVGVKTRF